MPKETAPEQTAPRPATDAWSETDSATYRALAEIAVPHRAEQLATMLCLLPFPAGAAFRVVDIGCGEGVFVRAVLDAFSNARAAALDGSPSMRSRADALITDFAPRAEIVPFDLESRDWLPLMDGADAVASSLVIHHLDDGGKRALFSEAHSRIADPGALIIADLTLPQRPEAWRLQADAYDRACRAQSENIPNGEAAYRRLISEEWNYYRHPEDTETPSPLSRQLAWLADAGFSGVDCFWMQAGHAIYGGYKGDAPDSGAGPFLSLADALAAANAAIAANAALPED